MVMFRISLTDCVTTGKLPGLAKALSPQLQGGDDR